MVQGRGRRCQRYPGQNEKPGRPNAGTAKSRLTIGDDPGFAFAVTIPVGLRFGDTVDMNREIQHFFLVQSVIVMFGDIRLDQLRARVGFRTIFLHDFV